METTRNKIERISQYYSQKNQMLKLKEELKELLIELDRAVIPFKMDEVVILPDNTWSECADVLIMIAQIAMQHGKEEKIRQQIAYKVDRQLGRIAGQEEWKEKIMRRFAKRE